jgi:CheY-like chemotaxis protein
MARVLALVDDLLFGSRLQGTLAAAGHEVELISDEPGLRERIAAAPAPPDTILVVDLTSEQLDGASVLEALAGEGRLGGLGGTLGFYAHVDMAARERAEEAGFDLVVPRSRVAREAPALIERLRAAT